VRGGNIFDDSNPFAGIKKTRTLPQAQPQCESSCINSPAIIKSNLEGHSYLAFKNFGNWRTGYCRGHALVTQKMSILAKFKNEARCDITQTVCLDGIKAGIKKIMNFQAHTFYGYENLFEFSQVKPIKNHLKKLISSVSSKYKSTKAYIKDRSYSSEKFNMYYEILRRVEEGQLPYVGVKGRKTGKHALLVFNTSFEYGQKVLCVRDSNVTNDDVETCDNFLFIEGDNIYYERYKRYRWYKTYYRSKDLMIKLKLTGDEDLRVKKYTHGLYNRCLKSKFSTCN